MRVGLLFRLCVLWGLGVATVKAAKRTVPGRMSRQTLEADLVDGVWSNWGEWSECSQSCGLGVSHRSRKCLPPPPPQAPPHSLSPPHWAGYMQRGMGGPYISPMGSYYPPHYPGQHSPYHSSSATTNHNQGLSLFRNVPSGGGGGGGGVGEGGGGPPIMGHSRQPTLYQQDYSAANQDRTPFHRSSYQSPPLGYGQPGRIIRRPTNPGATRGGGGGARRSVSTSRESLPVKRSSTIRPGQFGYGRVPFSLPLHRPNRQARHTVNGTDEGIVEETSETPSEDEEEVSNGEDVDAEMEEEDIGNTEEEVTITPAEEEPSTTTTTTTTGQPQRHMDQPSHSQAEIRRSRERVSPFQPFHRSSVPSVHSNRHRFDWHSVTAPPPPISSHSRSSSSDLPSAFSPSLHRPGPVHRDGEVHPDFIPQSNIYPLQHPHNSHLGIDSSHSDDGRAAPHVYRCFGPEKEYRRCFSQVCAGGVSNSRAEQCAAFNTQEFMGRLYNWEPFTEVGVDKQCELTCRPAGYRFYVRQAERVRDGTPCFNISSNDVCVEGRCLTEGCNGVLGSGSMIDKCGVCGGQETSCQKVTGSFKNATVPLGYHKILDIPPGATFINITERRASPNYLAMRSGTGASVVNGRWAVDPPGEYQAGGTTFTYTRPRAQAEGQEERGESLSAPGPTTAQLQLYIIFHNENPGIDYEFYIPVEKPEKEGERERKLEREREAHITLHRGSVREPARAPLRSPLTVSIDDPPPAPPPISAPSSASSSPSSSSSVFSSPSFGRWTPDRLRPRGSAPNRNARIPPRTDLPPDTEPPFVWRRGGFTECSASCGKGFQHRVLLCISRYTDEEVQDIKCDSAARPVPEEEPCNVHPCPPFWEVSAWSECSVSCGSGVQQRQLQCRQSFGNRSTMVHPQRCAGLTPPESMQTCQLSLCSHWEVGSDWSSCSVDCGVGRRTRNVRCVSDQGSIVNDQECNSRLRPQGTEDCNMGPCVTNWYFTAWSNTCSAQCGPGVQKRDVVCLTKGGVREGGGAGDCVAEKPAEMKACNGGPCVAITMWYSSPWSQCNVRCGNGTQRRDNICVQKLGNDYAVVQPSQCTHLDKPVAVQECEMGECEPRWFTTEWSACSRSCGKGLQMREVRCLTPDKRHSYDCDPTTKPDQEQICNTIPCSPQVPDENCRDRRHNCMMVVQARLCVYSYYKTACCASCTQSAQRAKRH